MILVAEDNPTNRTVVRRQIERLGYAAVIVDDGDEALDALAERRFAALLTDCHMPRLNGYDLAKRIRAESPDAAPRLPIIAITASALEVEVERCYQSGIDDVLPKPLELSRLRAALRKWLGPPGQAGAAPVDGAAPIDGPMDLDAQRDLLGDDPESILQILKEFIEPGASCVAEMRAAFDAESAPGVAGAAHKLKSAARAIGARDLADLCQALETAGRAGEWSELRRLKPTMAPVFERVVDHIEGL